MKIFFFLLSPSSGDYAMETSTNMSVRPHIYNNKICNPELVSYIRVRTYDWNPEIYELLTNDEPLTKICRNPYGSISPSTKNSITSTPIRNRYTKEGQSKFAKESLTNANYSL